MFSGRLGALMLTIALLQNRSEGDSVESVVETVSVS